MKPLFHPSADDISVEGILHALSDPARAQLFAEIVQSDSARTCSALLELTDRTVPKSTLSQHFKALREAGLIRSERRGVEMYNTPRCTEVDRRFPGLLAAIVNAHKMQTERAQAVRRRTRRRRA